jgi:ubiquinone/menaquinone biosynthesis C-methylase UbiE
VYDDVSWSIVSKYTAPPPTTIVDAGCGTGRWAAKWLAQGHSVVGIEQSPGMTRVLREKQLGPNFQLIENNMEAVELPDESADLVVAMGSLQYTEDPAAMIARFARWVRPGGAVCVHTDSRMALVLELMRTGQTDEAWARLHSPVGIWAVAGQQAGVHLFDKETLEAAFVRAGLTEVTSHGLLVSATIWERDVYSRMIAEDPAGFKDRERRLAEFPLMADAGKHILTCGRR